MATDAERLAEAQAAFHQLQIGKSIVELTDQNGEKITYTPASRQRLASYIADLQARVNKANVGPLRVYF